MTDRPIRLSGVDFTESELKRELMPLLRKNAQELESTTRWAERLVEETRNALALLPFTASEKEFLDTLLDYGQIEPVLLTGDEGLAARIRHHPGLEWKALNVREFKGR